MFIYPSAYKQNICQKEVIELYAIWKMIAPSQFRSGFSIHQNKSHYLFSSEGDLLFIAFSALYIWLKPNPGLYGFRPSNWIYYYSSCFSTILKLKLYLSFVSNQFNSTFHKYSNYGTNICLIIIKLFLILHVYYL